MTELRYRRATAADVPRLVALLAEDDLGQDRENRSSEASAGYLAAFAAINSDPNQFLCVVEEETQVVGTFQLTFIPGLSRGGALRGQIEAVRIAGDRRGEGLGKAMFAWAVEACRSRGCSIVQLTTDKARLDAHRFYDRIGFEPTHIGYKRHV